MKYTPTDQLHLPFEGWLRYFFTFALVKKKNFYWAWDRFMIVVRKEHDRIVLVLEIFLPDPPFLIQKHIDITSLPSKDLVASLLFLYHHYKSSPRLRRNQEHSLHFLSFGSFVHMLPDLPKLPVPSCGSGHYQLVAYLLKTLDFYDIPFRFLSKSTRIYSFSQLSA